MSSKRINVFYRGPLERSRLGFLLELFSDLGAQVYFIWLLPHPKFQNKNHQVLEPFMESFPEIDYTIIPAGIKQFLGARKSVNEIIKREPNALSVLIGFTAPYFLPFKKSGNQIWCINGIPEESLLHRDTKWKRKEISIKWNLLKKFFSLDLIVTVSQRMSDYVSIKLPKTKVISIPLCVDLERFQRGEKRRKKYFTYSGSGAPWQNLKQLNEVWISLHRLDPQLKFRVISRDPRARILGNQLPSHAVEFVGTSDLDELAEFLSEAEVGFLIRKNSLVNRVSFPTKLSEYLASRAWVVVSDIDWDIADLVKKYQVGVLVKPDLSSDQIAEKIIFARTDFSEEMGLEKRLDQAVQELGKSYWLEKGKNLIKESGVI